MYFNNNPMNLNKLEKAGTLHKAHVNKASGEKPMYAVLSLQSKILFLWLKPWSPRSWERRYNDTKASSPCISKPHSPKIKITPNYTKKTLKRKITENSALNLIRIRTVEETKKDIKLTLGGSLYIVTGTHLRILKYDFGMKIK